MSLRAARYYIEHRNNRQPLSVRAVCRMFGITIKELHKSARCLNGASCTGQGCRLR